MQPLVVDQTSDSISSDHPCFLLGGLRVNDVEPQRTGGHCWGFELMQCQGHPSTFVCPPNSCTSTKHDSELQFQYWYHDFEPPGNKALLGDYPDSHDGRYFPNSGEFQSLTAPKGCRMPGCGRSWGGPVANMRFPPLPFAETVDMLR